jgi:hypothetical protein
MMKVVLKIEMSQLFWDTFFRKWVSYSGTEGVTLKKNIEENDINDFYQKKERTEHI